MKRNASEKVFTTMLDILCDYLCIVKEVENGVNYPTKKNESSPNKD